MGNPDRPIKSYPSIAMITLADTLLTRRKEAGIGFYHILDFIEENWEIGRLLDIGAGYGFFLIVAQQRGWEAKGI